MKESKNCTVVFTVKEYDHPIERALKLDDFGNIKMILHKHYKTRTQDFKKSYHDAGQFYLCRSDVVRKSVALFNKNSKFIILPRSRTIDIDNQEDIEIAEALMKSKISN